MDRLRVVPGDAIGSQAHGLDGPPANERVGIERQRNKASQKAMVLHGHFGNRFEPPFGEQLRRMAFMKDASP